MRQMLAASNSGRTITLLMPRYDGVSGFILAGGISSRMGRDKGLLEFAGLPLIVQTARLIEPLVSSTAVIGAPERYAGLGLRVIGDQFFDSQEPNAPGAGPLAGIATALATSSTIWNLVLACDLPYLTSAWLEWLLSRAICSKAQMVIP